jgi:exonuclease III
MAEKLSFHSGFFFDIFEKSIHNLSMKIITWNCNGAFRKKFSQLESFDADIIVIQECEDPKMSNDKKYKEWASNFIWIGDNKNKGLGMFCKASVKLSDNNWDTNGLKYFISANIDNNFNIIGLWNHHANSPTFGYIGQFWKYLQINKPLMTKTLITGDFNSNKIWDKWDRWWNHSDVVKELEEIEIRSLYHEYFNEKQGEEQVPTFYLQRNISKPYHIDYAFADKKVFKKIKNIIIGQKNDWLELSDHMPIIIEF